MITMNNTALVQIQGGRWDGSLFEILIDPNTNEPPPEFRISDDGLALLTLSDPPQEIGRIYGSNSAGTTFLSPEAAEATESD